MMRTWHQGEGAMTPTEMVELKTAIREAEATLQKRIAPLLVLRGFIADGERLMDGIIDPEAGSMHWQVGVLIKVLRMGAAETR